LPLLGGLSAATFMQRHWQKKPLLIRGAVPDMKLLASRAELFKLAAQEGVESRLIVRQGTAKKPSWQVEHGPLKKADLPSFDTPNWTALVQGVDLHLDSAHELIQQFRFAPDARLDDLMISYATDGGGVGPHFDSYDVFLLQAHGQRRWRIGRQKDLSLQVGVPLKILAHFEPEQEFVLNPGDMLYLPPRYAHDGIAVGECMTYSIGFRSPNRGEVMRELLLRWADRMDEQKGADQRYSDPDQAAVTQPAELPAAMTQWMLSGAAKLMPSPGQLELLWGEYLTEPKSNVWFDIAADTDQAPPWTQGQGVRLDRRSHMMVNATHLFINGESWRCTGKDAKLMNLLANSRSLSAEQIHKASPDAQDLLLQWLDDGWLQISEN
jgi:50S ribosomal protein L16 3-hydroxylase